MPEPPSAASSNMKRVAPVGAPSDDPVVGTTSIEAAFAAAREEGRAALMPYLMGGFPDQGTATAIARAYADADADLIELGVPFSDPLADGPVIHAADTAALEAGATLDSVLETCAAVADRVPVALMCYANMVLATGAVEFAVKAAEAGAAAVIVPDLPLEEQDSIIEALSEGGLGLVPLVAPTTPPERRREICARAGGFVYLVSTIGVTGERQELPEELTDLVAAAKEQAATVGKIADGVIIGTRLVREVADAADREQAVRGVTEFLASARDALSR